MIPSSAPTITAGQVNSGILASSGTNGLCAGMSPCVVVSLVAAIVNAPDSETRSQRPLDEPAYLGGSHAGLQVFSDSQLPEGCRKRFVGRFREPSGTLRPNWYGRQVPLGSRDLPAP